MIACGCPSARVSKLVGEACSTAYWCSYSSVPRPCTTWTQCSWYV
jgi:hypothetical protein